MTKFGELINVEKPVLIDFYFDWDDEENNLDTLKDVAAALGDKAKVIKEAEKPPAQLLLF